MKQNSKIVSEIKKQEKKKKSKKFKINMKKAGFIMILLFCIVLVFFGLSIVLKNYKCRQKEAAFNKRNTERKGYNTGNNADSNWGSDDRNSNDTRKKGVDRKKNRKKDRIFNTEDNNR